jgi:hypothetical protein
MRLTAKQAADRLNISYVVASGLMSHLEDVGKAKVAEKVFHVSGKGKPTRVYEVDNNVVLNFGEDVLQVSVIEDVVAVVEMPVVETVVEEIVPLQIVAEDSKDTVEEIVPTVADGGGYWDDEDEDDVAA